MRHKIILLCLFLAVAGLALGGCPITEETNITEPPPPPPVPPAKVTCAGAANINGTGIDFVDRSSIEPASQASPGAVLWELRSGSATVIDSDITDLGGRGSFGPGLAPATYTVDQHVRADDGSSGSCSYPGLTVTGF